MRRMNVDRQTYLAVDVSVRGYGAAAEVAQFPPVVNTEEHVLWLEVAMGDWGLLGVHVQQALDYVPGDEQDFTLWQAFGTLVCPRLNQVE